MSVYIFMCLWVCLCLRERMSLEARRSSIPWRWNYKQIPEDGILSFSKWVLELNSGPPRAAQALNQESTPINPFWIENSKVSSDWKEKQCRHKAECFPINRENNRMEMSRIGLRSWIMCFVICTFCSPENSCRMVLWT